MEWADAWVSLLQWLGAWVGWLTRRLSSDSAWRRGPQGFDTLWRATLRNDGLIYTRLLRRFDQWCVEHGKVLELASDVDTAAAEFLKTLGRGEGSQFVSALLKAFPPLRYALPWAVATRNNLVATATPQHHPPLTWRLCLGLAAVLCLLGRKGDAVGLLVQWRLGLRPGEAQRLLPEHIWLPTVPQLCAIVRLGVGRSTKVGRQQYVRVYPEDHLTMWLLQRVKSCRGPQHPIGKWRSTQQQTFWMRRASVLLALGDRWSAHSPRAGWASARHLAGQPIAELQGDGRWSSVGTLKIYLDVIGSMQAEAEQASVRLSGWLDELEQQFVATYMWF